jgi:uncharacterized spore protein YtfJ
LKPVLELSLRRETLMPSVEEVMEGTRDILTVRRVFGDPYEADGVTFVPAAAVRGGGGGGEGEDPKSGGSGGGSGFGVSARPVGAYQIRDGEVTWVPAADTTRVIILGEVFALVVVLVIRSVLRKRRKK